jgi:hypothetical protein
MAGASATTGCRARKGSSDRSSRFEKWTRRGLRWAYAAARGCRPRAVQAFPLRFDFAELRPRAGGSSSGTHPAQGKERAKRHDRVECQTAGAHVRSGRLFGRPEVKQGAFPQERHPAFSDRRRPLRSEPPGRKVRAGGQFFRGLAGPPEAVRAPGGCGSAPRGPRRRADRPRSPPRRRC